MAYIIFIVILFLACLIMAFLLVRTKKHDSETLAAELGKYNAINEAIVILKKLLNAHKNDNIDEKQWNKNVCIFFQENFRADGCCIIRKLAEDKNIHDYEMLVGSGCCETWNDAGDGNNLIFESEIQNHFFWSSDAHLLTDKVSECLPADQAGKYSSIITGVFKIHKHNSFLLLLRKLDQKPYTMDDLKDFEPCFHIARSGMEIVNYVNENNQLIRNIDKAHEEGMLQISSGIIHNIGNGMAVMKMTLEHLEEFKSIIKLSKFLQEEVLPAVEKDIKSMKGDAKLEQYVVVLKEIIEKINITAKGHDEELEKLGAKFQDVIEIISLQQQFIGELGTENVVSISTILGEVIKMIQQPLEQGNIKLRQDIKTFSEVLLDPALFRQVLLVICKYSIDSINAIKSTKSYLEINAYDIEESEVNENDEKIDKKLIFIEVNNNGFGIEFDPAAEFIGHSKGAQQHRELVFCKNKIEKYGGSFEIESAEGRGAKIQIKIPRYNK